MSRIVIATLNARYIHTAFGLRYLYANMGELQACTSLLEFGIKQRAHEIVEQLLDQKPAIIGLGVYIWNVAEMRATVAILKQVAPEVVLVLGGPEVSHPPDLPPLADEVDYLITGPGEISFPKLCRQIFADQAPAGKVIQGEKADLSALHTPYPYYTDSDLRQRIVYVEASRGCPYKCAFCLSALDVTSKPFNLAGFLHQMEKLYQRGGRNFKFIDRTFNLKTETSVAILEFFLQRLTDDLYLHFEVIPDNLPERLKQVIQQFPPGQLQFEVGIQSFDPRIQQLINRKQDNHKTRANLIWLRERSAVHVHADLIVGLPGDSLENFGQSFDQLFGLRPQEIQVGILKRLRGAPINRHTEVYQMRYDPNPPYSILCTADMSFSDIQRLQRFSRFWDLIGNSGRFQQSLPLILGDQPFQRFLQFSDALYLQTGSTWQIALKRLFELSYFVMTHHLQIAAEASTQVIEADFLRSGDKGRLQLGQAESPQNNKSTLANKRQLNF